MSANSIYSTFYARWLRSERVVSERLATCDRCVMTQAREGSRDPGPFDAHLKCCTYFPFIPNFALGALLSSGQGDIRTRLKVAASYGFASPLGLFPRKSQSIPKADFGRRREMLCPFFDSARESCGIWDFRPGVCATYFCVSEHGEKGQRFWKSVEEQVNSFEWTLAHASLWRMGFTQDELQQMEELRSREDALASRLWLEWRERKFDLYVESYRQAEQITSDELAELMGAGGDSALTFPESLC